MKNHREGGRSEGRRTGGEGRRERRRGEGGGAAAGRSDPSSLRRIGKSIVKQGRDVLGHISERHADAAGEYAVRRGAEKGEA